MTTERGQPLAQGDAGPQPARAPAAPADTSRFRQGDRVEVNVNGTWYAASIANADGDRYRVMRDDRAFGVGSTEEWIASDRLRRLAAANVAAAPPPAGALPNVVPTGLYSCTSADNGNTMGKLRIVNANTSSGITPDGGGPQHQFTYNTTSGAIAWPAGLQIFNWTIRRAEYRPAPNGTPSINLDYQVRAGGNLNSMGCRRE